MVAAKEKRKRIDWIDVTKGIAIILMVIGHAALPQMLQWFIFSFHMPLFFILSGVTTDWYNCGFKDFFVRKLYGLGIPFIIYSAISFSIILAFDLVGPSWWRGWGDYALWFVPVLFISLLISKLVMACNGWIRVALLMILPIISSILRVFSVELPWNMSVAPFAAFFIILGGLESERIKAIKKANLLYLILAFSIAFIISQYWHLDMARNQCMPLLPLIVAAIAGTIFVSGFSVLIDHSMGYISALLKAIGKETFIILSFSQVIILALNKYFDLWTVFKYALLCLFLCIIKITKDSIVKYTRQ